MRALLLKLSITIAILGVLFISTDIKALVDSFRNLKPMPMLYAFVFVISIRLLMTLRWKLILSYYNVEASLWKLFEIIFVSNSVGHLLPSGIGTDIVRTYELSKAKGFPEQIFASVFLDRVFGLISMLIVALLTAWLAYARDLIALAIPVSFSGALLLMIGGYYLLRQIAPKNITSSLQYRWLEKIVAFYNRFMESLTVTNLPFRGLLILFFLSISVQITRTIVFMFIFASTGAALNAIFYFIFIPIIFIIMLVPVSIGGLGVRESALFVFFGPLGISLADCIVSGLAFHAIQLVLIIPGLMLFVLKGNKKRAPKDSNAS